MFGYPRLIYAGFVALTLLAGGLLVWLAPAWLVLWLIPAALVGVGAFDLASDRNVLRNFPIVGHLRYMLEFIRPELRQYFFESETSGRPFSREQREMVYARGAAAPDTAPFGTIRDFEAPGYNFALHSMAPKSVDARHGRLVIGNHQCRRPYDASRLNVSAMSFGSLSGNAVAAMNRGAALGGFAQDTGEGAISDHHRAHGGDLIWEIASAYFGCRTDEGRFDPDEFASKARTDQVRMIEIKISQGAKPGHGGLLPGAKVTDEIARVREIEPGRDCASPASHPEFDTPLGRFVERLRALADGKQVGRSVWAIGTSSWASPRRSRPGSCGFHHRRRRGWYRRRPSSRILGTYIDDTAFVHACRGHRRARSGQGDRQRQGRDGFRHGREDRPRCGYVQRRAGVHVLGRLPPGAALSQCPTGVATQDPRRAAALDVLKKSLQVRNYHDATVKSFLDIVGTMGLDDPDALTYAHIKHRPEHGHAETFAEIEPPVATGDFLADRIPEAYRADWARARADSFAQRHGVGGASVEDGWLHDAVAK